MKCLRCQSLRILKFVDGFGQKRVFCRKCGGSFLEMSALNYQKNLLEFDQSLYQKFGFHKWENGNAEENGNWIASG